MQESTPYQQHNLLTILYPLQTDLPSDMQLMFSSAFIPLLNGLNASKVSMDPNFAKSNTAS